MTFTPVSETHRLLNLLASLVSVTYVVQHQERLRSHVVAEIQKSQRVALALVKKDGS